MTARPSTSPAPRRIGLVGGMSWRSTMLYYQRLNESFEARLGVHRSFPGLICNLDYASLLAAAEKSDWGFVERSIVEAACELRTAGCDVIALTAVTAHVTHDAVARAVNCVVPHVLDRARHQLDRDDIRSIGLLSTSATARSPFVDARLGAGRRAVLRLDAAVQADIDHLIQQVLTARRPDEGALHRLRAAADQLAERGAQAILLACTELPLLTPLPGFLPPLIDSVALHVEAIADAALAN